MEDAKAPRGLAGLAGLAYAYLAFLMTFAFFTQFVLFLGNLPTISNPWLPKTVDTGTTLSPFSAAIVDLGLVALFGLQHSLMARPSFKDWWTRTVPKGLERSTYVVAASLAGFVMVWFWQPIRLVIWDASGPMQDILWVLFGLGWLLLLVSGIGFNLFDLLGVRQAWAWYHGRPTPQLELKTHWLYGWLEHPMYAGVLLGIWMTPYMTIGHMLMAAAFTLYILIAMRYEQRDLSRIYGDAYAAWRQGAPVARPRS
jgi:protein-S-isoprenylcysteine O-methyltransferase Ste14